MLDPIFEWLGRLWQGLLAAVRALIALITSPFRATYQLFQRSGLIIRIVIGAILLPLVISYVWFAWHALWIRDYDVDYPKRFQLTDQMRPAGEQVAVEGGEETTKTCGRSNVVDITADLIDFNVNRNKWMSSHPLYKAGIFSISRITHGS